MNESAQLQVFASNFMAKFHQSYSTLTDRGKKTLEDFFNTSQLLQYFFPLFLRDSILGFLGSCESEIHELTLASLLYDDLYESPERMAFYKLQTYLESLTEILGKKEELLKQLEKFYGILEERIEKILQKSNGNVENDWPLMDCIGTLIGKQGKMAQFQKDLDQKKQIDENLRGDFEIDFEIGKGDKFWWARKVMVEKDTDERLRFLASLWTNSPNLGADV